MQWLFCLIHVLVTTLRPWLCCCSLCPKWTFWLDQGRLVLAMSIISSSVHQMPLDRCESRQPDVPFQSNDSVVLQCLQNLLQISCNMSTGSRNFWFQCGLLELAIELLLLSSSRSLCRDRYISWSISLKYSKQCYPCEFWGIIPLHQTKETCFRLSVEGGFQSCDWRSRGSRYFAV